MTTFKPAGKLYDVKSLYGGEAKAYLEADDLLIALDAKTGKTLWKAAELGGFVWGEAFVRSIASRSRLHPATLGGTLALAVAVVTGVGLTRWGRTDLKSAYRSPVERFNELARPL